MGRIRAAWLVGLVVALGTDAQGALSKVKGRVVAADGSPVVGAEVATFWIFDEGKCTAYGGVKTGADGRFEIDAEFYKRPGPLLAVTADRTGGGWVTVEPEQIPDSVEIKTGPLVRVHGDFSCTDLGKKPEWTNIYILSEDQKERLAGCSSQAASFDLLLPVGKYVLSGYGTQDVQALAKKLDLKAETPDVNLGTLDLPASPLGKMYDKEAPPLHITDARGVSKDMKLTDFKGKWVVLDFWGYWCGPCVGRSLPDLMQMYDEYVDDRDKFVFLAFHDKQAKDFAELDAKLVPIVRDIWGGRNLPFPILLDATGQTVEEYGIRAWPTTVLINPEGKVVRGSEETLREYLPQIPIARRIPLALDKQAGFGLADGIKLDQFVKYMAQVSNLPIKLDDQALAAAKVAQDTLIPLTMTGQVSLRSWLELGLHPLGLVAVPDAEGLIVRPQADAPPELSSVQKSVAERIEHKLGEPTSFDFKGQTLAEIASYFEEQTRENFVLDPADRLAHRLDPKATVTGKADGVSLRAGLKLLLKPLGIEAVVRNEVVILTRPATP